MTYILYHKNLNFKQKFRKYLSRIPSEFHAQILKYKNRRDAERCLAGKLLLQEGLKIMGFHEYKIADLKYSAYQRPYFDHHFDFNIAHSGKYVVCALSESGKVGVDIEEVRPTALQDFQRIFTAPEWSRIMSAEESLQAFYTLWTKKEAIIKASGEGLSIPLEDVLIEENKAVVHNEKWHLTPLELSPDYIGYLASDSDSQEITMRHIQFD